MKIKLVASLMFGAVLVGCGGVSSTSTTTSPQLEGGQVSDGYIKSAEVLVDIISSKDNKGVYDKGDYNTLTDAQGNFVIPESISVKDGTLIYAKGGVNIATGEEFNGTLKGVYSGSSSIVLTPLTTMVAAKVENGDSLDDAKQHVAKALGISKESVDADPAKDIEALKATQQIVAVAKVIQSDDSTKSISDVMEELAKNISSDGNFTKAIDDTTNPKTAQAAKETAQAVKDAIETLEKSFEEEDASSSAAIENIVNEYVVDVALDTIKEDGDLSKALEDAKKDIEDGAILDVAKAVACLDFDTIKAKNSSIDSVSSDLDLDAKSSCEKLYGVKISWISATPQKVDLKTGAIEQENYEDVDVVLEANVSKSDKFTIKPLFITLSSKGHKPVAANDSVTVDENSAVTIDVLANDKDEDGLDTLKLEISSDPSNGSASVKDSKIVYTPNKGYVGNDSLKYKLIDPLGAESEAVVNIVVMPTNSAPVAVDDTIKIKNNEVAYVDVLSNDLDSDGDSLKIVSITKPSSGVASIVDGKIKYTPVAGFVGSVTISYTISDGSESATAKVTIEVIDSISKITQAVSEVENYDLEDNDLETLLNKTKDILSGASSSEKDAQVGLAIVDLFETLDTQVDNLISVNNLDSENLRELLVSDDLDIKLADTISDLSDQTQESSTEVAAKLIAVSQKLDDLYSDPNYTFTYDDFTLNANDAKAISALLELEAAKLEYIAAYKIAKKEYAETKSETLNINGANVDVEYQVVKADPKTALNDSEVLSLNSEAQTHLDRSKEILNSALTKLAAFDKTKSQLDFKDKIDENKAKLSAIKTSLNGGADFVSEDEDGTKTYINVAALFDIDTAPTLSNTLGNNWSYIADSKSYPYEYNATLSKYKNEPIGSYYSSDDSQLKVADMEASYISVPMGSSSKLPAIITKVESSGNTYSGDDVIKYMLGDVRSTGSTLIKEYTNASDVNIVYTITDEPTGYTGPYSCSFSLINAYNTQTDQEVDGNSILSATMSDNTHCQITVTDDSFVGYIYYEVSIEDKYGHKEERYRGFEITGDNQGDSCENYNPLTGECEDD